MNLTEWIIPSQSRFVPGRCIFDNIYLAYETCWGEESNQPLVMLLLNFEKSYDRLSWSFVEASMAKMGFHHNWIKMVCFLYASGRSSVLVNGLTREEFDIPRSVRQACPHSTYLFLKAANVLEMILKDPKYEV